MVFCVFLARQQSDVTALVAGASDSVPTLPTCRGLSCLRLRGGMFGFKKKKETPPPEPVPEPFPFGRFMQVSVATIATMGLGSADPDVFKEVVVFGIQRWQLLIAGSYAAFFLANTVPGAPLFPSPSQGSSALWFF